MRLICTIAGDMKDQNPYAFSYFLAGQGIENECEEIPTADGVIYRVWIEEEDQVERAQAFYEEYRADPHHPRYHQKYDVHEKETQNDEEAPEERAPVRRGGLFSSTPYGPISIIILVAVIGLFVWGLTQRTMLVPPEIKGVVLAPVLPKIDRLLLFDFPKYFELRDELIKLYTKKDVDEKRPPSKEARELLREMQNTPVWLGFYPRLVAYLQDRSVPLTYEGPLFGKIREGQVWRLFTPCLLHLNLLHIFFDVLWFLLLTNQIEYRLGSLRYAVLILLTGILPNVAQYLMSGPFFMGLSGVVVGLAGFIWARQQMAPWEGYLLPRITLIFLAAFVLGMFLIQTILFFAEVFGTAKIHFIFANTAHIVGGLVGYGLGRMRLFSIRHFYR